jgi:Putative peptidoglycan binding domain
MLVSIRFAGDPVLEACLAGDHRMLSPESGPAVGKVQQALIDLGFELPQFEVDSHFGEETAQAVTAFKQGEGIEPSDGVVGKKTMAALDAHFSDLVVPLPPPEPEFGADPFGRRPEADAKVPAAEAIVAAFRANPAGSNWLHLDRSKVADGIARLITSADLAEQGGNGQCTAAAFVNVWAQDAPDAYAAFATTLYDTAAATIAPNQGAAGVRITPSIALLGGDYGAIAERMRARDFPVPSQADWMVMSALRDSSNSVVDFTGDPDDFFSHHLGDGGDVDGSDLETWMRSTGLFTSVSNEVNRLFTKSPDHAKALDPRHSRCVLKVDAAMLAGTRAIHNAVLRGPITEIPPEPEDVEIGEGGFYDFRVWTWAAVRFVRAEKQMFEASYYGACIGFF